jgi:hypothetical protein
MRSALGLVLGWFGLHEILAPADWARFVPEGVVRISPIGVSSLVTLHGLVLLLAAVAITLGFLLRAACILAAGILFEVIVVLLAGGNAEDLHLVVRNVGCLGLAVAIALDPVRFWQVDLSTITRREPAAERATTPRRRTESGPGSTRPPSRPATE